MQSAIGIFALAACAVAVPAMPPVDPHNPLTNPATNRDLLLTNPSLAFGAASHFMTPEQQLTVQNQIITQKNLEALAAQLAARAGVPPPAGIQSAGPPTAAQLAHFQAQIQAHNQLREQAQLQAQQQAQFAAHNQALLQAQVQAQQAAAPRF
ncbi:hypothetical protein H4R18_005139 [Coemansia javaensis]|uniref:Uncharacterized protein n=1 Tax=Coemansia javaensis TaxID=2761396 RepID=A0A9W8H2H0_9FUNG|nr:hypothetical protein H4R18_005139 [Coemansia javaensis]